MSAAVSPASAKTYGVERVCAVWEQPRSSFYAWRLNNKSSGEPGPTAHKRGPKPGLSDVELLGKIQEDLVRTPFQGEATARYGRGCGCLMGFASRGKEYFGSCGRINF